MFNKIMLFVVYSCHQSILRQCFEMMGTTVPNYSNHKIHHDSYYQQSPISFFLVLMKITVFLPSYFRGGIDSRTYVSVSKPVFNTTTWYTTTRRLCDLHTLHNLQYISLLRKFFFDYVNVLFVSFVAYLKKEKFYNWNRLPRRSYSHCKIPTSI